MKPPPYDHHRAAGVLLGMAAGDALGAPYEFKAGVGPDVSLAMTGGSGWEPGEWTDDTDMAIAIAEAAANGAHLRDKATQDQVVQRWVEWRQQAKDVGIQTQAVLQSAAGSSSPATAATDAAAALHRAQGRSGGNGSLMRTAPVALAYLHDRDALIEAARTISALTHFDPEAGDACVLWCLAIRHAVLTGELDIWVGLDTIPAERRDTWQQRVETAEQATPDDFSQYKSTDGRGNGWVVYALQGAWSAITNTQTDGADHLRLGIEAAVRGGDDADTVAAIAGSLLGAAYGASAVPASWRRTLHGWPDLRGRDLIALGLRVAARGSLTSRDWPMLAQFDYSAWGDVGALAVHPHDPQLLLGGAGAVRQLPEGVDAVVSLCRLGAAEVPAPGVAAEEHVEVWLIDSPDSDANPHLDFVLSDTVAVVRQLRAEGKTVLLHCVQAQSRTPTIAALYSAAEGHADFDTAVRDIQAVLPSADPNPAFRQAAARLCNG